MLHWRFEAEAGVVCSYEWLRQSIPFGVSTPQDFEKDDSVYKTVYYTSMTPKLGRGWE